MWNDPEVEQIIKEVLANPCLQNKKDGNRNFNVVTRMKMYYTEDLTDSS